MPPRTFCAALCLGLLGIGEATTAPTGYPTIVVNVTLAPTAGPAGTCCTALPCHGDCIDSCSIADQLFETAFIKTVCDWQNIIFLFYIVWITWLGRRVYRVQYDLAAAGLRGEGGAGTGIRLALLGDDAYTSEAKPQAQTFDLGVDDGEDASAAGLTRTSSGNKAMDAMIQESASKKSALRAQRRAAAAKQLEDASKKLIMDFALYMDANSFMILDPKKITKPGYVNAEQLKQVFENCLSSNGIVFSDQVFRSAITKVGRADEDTTLYSTDFAALSTLQKEVGELEGGVSTNQFKNAYFKYKNNDHAVSVALAGFLFAVGMISFSAISEFSEFPQIDETTCGVLSTDTEYLSHVGWDSQSTSEGAKSRFKNVAFSLMWNIIGFVLIVGSQAITRSLTAGDMNLMYEIAGWTSAHKGNLAAAVAEAGTAIASGILVANTVGGSPRVNLYEDLFVTFGFFVLSQLALFVYARIFDMVYINGNIWQKVKNDHNVAAAISHSAMMISFALLIGNATYKSSELLSFGTWFVLGGVAQLFMRHVLDKLLLWGQNLDRLIDEDNNWGAALIVGSVQISVAQIMCDAQPDTCAGFAYKSFGGKTEHFISAPDLLFSTEFTENWVTRWEYLLFMLIVIVFLGLAKLMFTLPFKMHFKDGFSLEEAIAGRATSKMIAPASMLEPEPDMEAPSITGTTNSQGNAAIALSYAGYLAGTGLMFAGVFESDWGNLTLEKELAEVGMVVLKVVQGMLMMLIAQFLNDYVIMHHLQRIPELYEKHNVALACVEAGFYIATGLGVNKCMGKESMGTMWIMFVCHQGLLVIFNMVFEATTVYNDKEAVLSNNVAHGLNHGMNVVGFGVLLQRALTVSNSILVLVPWAAFGMLILMAFRRILSKLLFDHYHVDKEIVKHNWGAALIAGSVTVSLAQLLNTFLRDCAFNQWVH